MGLKTDIRIQGAPWCGEPAFPLQPWRLEGALYASVFAVPRARLPLGLTGGLRPMGLLGRVLVGAGFAAYGPGGVLQYDEALAAVLVRPGWPARITIPRIWVDSAASASGARAMWGIPKRLATFRKGSGPTFQATAEDARGPIVNLAFTPGLVLPGRWRLPLQVVQDGPRGRILTPAVIRGRLSLGRAAWSVAPHGPLAWLSGRGALLSVRLDRAELHFGRPAPPRRS